MSSGVEADGVVAAAVILPAAAAYGAGWLAWQGGKLLIEANRAANRQIAEQKRQREEAARHRRMAAVAAHRQLADMCAQILAQLEEHTSAGGAMGAAELGQLKRELKQLCEERLPEDTAQIESLTSLGYLKLDQLVRRQKQLAALSLADSEAALSRGLTVADRMDDLRIAISAMEIRETNGRDIQAADPAVLERARLNARFARVTGKIMEALAFVEELTTTYGLTTAGSAWFHSCFNGVDALVERLCEPTTSNKALKKGILRLEEALEQYETLAPEIEKEIKQMSALYAVYAEASKALGEPIESIKSFRNAAELEEKLKYLQTRAERAQACAAIYQKLGASAYLCYAWDQELKALGYAVHTRKKILEMASRKPEHAKLGETKLPFYQWNEEDLTQLYSITAQCALQVIVHEDGTVSMQTIADAENGEAVSAQHSHCAQLKLLHERLRQNWFILYDYEETAPADAVTTTAAWRASEECTWKRSEGELIMEQRAKEKSAPKAKHIQ